MTDKKRTVSCGLWRRWDGHIVYVIQASEEAVRFAEYDGYERIEPRKDFLGEINVGPVGDMHFGGVHDEVLVPKYQKVVGWHWQRHAGHSSHVSPKLEGWDK
jgi:hypothetical protein